MNGVPWDVAFSLPSADAAGMCVAIGELRGGEFDWNTMRWREAK